MQKKYNPEQTVEKIIAISTELFMEKGYDKTSMQDIINSLGMSKGAIFHHFSSKDAIFEAVMQRIGNAQMEVLTNMIANELQHLPAKDKLTALISASMNANTNDAAKIISTCIQDPKIIIGMMKHNMEISVPIVADILREGIEDGSIKTDYPDECAQVMMLLLNLWCDPVVFECDMFALRKRFAYLQHILRVSGVDIVTDKLLEKTIKFTENIYEVMKCETSAKRIFIPTDL